MSEITHSLEADICDRTSSQAYAESAVFVALLSIAGGAAVFWLVSGNQHLLLITCFSLTIHWIATAPIAREWIGHKGQQILIWPVEDCSRAGWNSHELILHSLVITLIIALIGVLAPWLYLAHALLWFVIYMLLAVSLHSLLKGIWTNSEKRNLHGMRFAFAFILGTAAWLSSPPTYAKIHPIFQTPVTRQSTNRPAVHVILKDDTEMGGLGTAELYLSVQSSRFPGGVHVLLPINRGDFQGCMQRFIQLPFEIQDGDNLTFELIDDNQMTPEQEQTILKACQAGGYCVRLGSAILAPEMDWIVAPSADVASEVIASTTVLKFRDSPFRNFGSATFIVQPSKPRTPSSANPINLLDKLNYSRAAVKVYYPPQPLE